MFHGMSELSGIFTLQILGPVLIANLLTVCAIWGGLQIDRAEKSTGDPFKAGGWAWAAILIPLALIAVSAYLGIMAE